MSPGGAGSWHAAPVAETTECGGCGAPGLPAGAAECAFCGAPAPPASGGEPDDRHLEDEREVVPPDLPEAQEARRIRGWAVPLVAGLVVVGVGYPLTALAVTQVTRVPALAGLAPSEPIEDLTGTTLLDPVGAPKAGRARLSGAVTFEGPVTPIGCNPAMPSLATFGAGEARYSILVSVPAGSPAGLYPLQPTSPTFVAVTRLTGGAQTWTSLAKGGPTGDVTLRADRSVVARFRGLEPNGGGAAGTVDGSVEVRCG